MGFFGDEMKSIHFNEKDCNRKTDAFITIVEWMVLDEAVGIGCGK